MCVCVYLQHFSVVPQAVNKVISMVMDPNFREKLDEFRQLNLSISWLLTTYIHQTVNKHLKLNWGGGERHSR